MKKKVKVFAPATVANVGPGFDVLGCAVSQVGDIVEVELRDDYNGEIKIDIVGDRGRLPLDENNTAFRAALEVRKILDEKKGLHLSLQKNLPLGSGLGSSAASSVASAWATNLLFGEKLKKEDLLDLLSECERLACGAAHFDNIAPCLLGSFVLVKENNSNGILRFDSALDLKLVIVSPQVEIKTKDSRDALPENVSMEQYVEGLSAVAALAYGIAAGDEKVFAEAVHKNTLLEKARGGLIPGFFEIKKKSLAAGALGTTISGSGPAIFSFCHDEITTKKVAQVMQDIFQEKGIDSKVYFSEIDKEGARELLL